MSMATLETEVSVGEAARILSVTVGRVRQLLIAGRLAGRKLNERAWAVDRRSVEAYRGGRQNS
jgi:hypothetical protein